jgi:hypothetical protein
LALGKLKGVRVVIVFNWLHLTDLHLGMTGLEDLWPNIEEQFFNDLKFLCGKVGIWDLVLFTGDLTQRGSLAEFGNVTQLLDKLWKKFASLDCSPKLLALPGNHDLTRPKSSSTLLTLMQLWESAEVQRPFWDDPKCPQRKLLSKAFANYTQWWDSMPADIKPEVYSAGALPGDFAATMEKQGIKVGIVGLNSTFLQLTGGNLKGKLAVDMRQFNDPCQGHGPDWVKGHDVCLLLTHQPPDWLTKKAENQLNGEIHSPPHRFALHLFGHMHEANLSSLAEGGPDARRRLQGCSLFGMEGWGERKEERLHGYSLCQLRVGRDNAKMRIWPRRAVRKKDGGLEIGPDPSFRLRKEDNGTEPMIVRLLRDRPKRPRAELSPQGRKRTAAGPARRPPQPSRPAARRTRSAQVPPVGSDQLSSARRKLESLERVRDLGDKFRDRAFKPREVQRKLIVDRPNAEIEVLENLMNASERAQGDVVRCLATDTRTEENDLDFKAWVKLKGKEREAAVSLAKASEDRRKFAFRISFGGAVVNQGESVQIRWKCKMPGSVTLNEDYWIFPLNYFERPPDSLIVKVAFAKNPADRGFFAVAKAGREQPLNISGPVERTITGRTWYVYAAAVQSPRDLYVFRWRYLRTS